MNSSPPPLPPEKIEKPSAGRRTLGWLLIVLSFAALFAMLNKPGMFKDTDALSKSVADITLICVIGAIGAFMAGLLSSKKKK